MADFHGVVVDDIRQMVGGITVRFEHYKVIDSAQVEGYPAVNNIIMGNLTRQRCLETHHRPDAGNFFLGALLRSQ